MLTFKSGDVIIQEGTNFQKIYQIISGSCRVEKNVSSNQPKLLSIIPPGEIFGEISFLEKGETSASVRAASEKVEVCVVEGTILNALFQSTPGLGARFHKFLAGVTEKRLRIRETVLQKQAANT
jgi:CRP-like cAMP-binding protein